MALTKRGKLARKAGKFRQQVRAQVRRIPAPQIWPTWIHHTVHACCFLAGVGAILLWQAAPDLVMLIAVLLIGLFIFVR
jgi:fatty acid desaturase